MRGSTNFKPQGSCLASKSIAAPIEELDPNQDQSFRDMGRFLQIYYTKITNTAITHLDHKPENTNEELQATDSNLTDYPNRIPGRSLGIFEFDDEPHSDYYTGIVTSSRIKDNSSKISLNT